MPSCTVKRPRPMPLLQRTRCYSHVLQYLVLCNRVKLVLRMIWQIYKSPITGVKLDPVSDHEEESEEGRMMNVCVCILLPRVFLGV